MPVHRLSALKKLSADDSQPFIRGQYESYRREVDNPSTRTETFTAITLKSEDPRWKDVPIRLVTGKNLKEKLTEIRVYFKKMEETEENLLILRIQPREAIVIQIWVKQPGYERRLQKIPHEFTYNTHFDHLPEAYEQVLVDAMSSNHSLFAGSEEVLESWRILKPVQQKWLESTKDIKTYSPGSAIEEILKN
jgi:glucose-6-phosphate 1-dehydrogenase